MIDADNGADCASPHHNNRICPECGSKKKYKRYVGTLTFFIYAEDDEAAKNEADEIAHEIDQHYDNKAAIEQIHLKSGAFESLQVYPPQKPLARDAS